MDCIKDKLFRAILYNNIEEASRLKANGEKLSEEALNTLLKGSDSGERYEFCVISGRLSDDDFIRVMSELISEIGEDKKLCYNDKFYQYNEERLYDTKQLRFILDHFNQSRIPKGELMRALIDRDNAACLAVVTEEYGWLKQPKKRDEMIQYASENGKTECTAFLMDFKSRTANLTAERQKAEKKAQRELNAAPDSATAMKQIWNFKKQNDGTLIITKYKGSKTEITVPAKIGKDTVTAIDKYVFSPSAPGITTEQAIQRRDITKITLPDTLKYIGNGAFYNIDEIPKIIIPDGVIEIGEAVFSGCASLKEVSLPDSIQKIGKQIFYYSTALECITLPPTIAEIPDKAFAYCKNLKTVEIPESVRKIEKNAFYNCDSLEKIVIPNGAENIAREAFGKCPNLKTVVIPASVNKIAVTSDSSKRTIFFESPNVTAIVEPKSCAEKYCKKNEIPYKYKED